MQNRGGWPRCSGACGLLLVARTFACGRHERVARRSAKSQLFSRIGGPGTMGPGSTTTKTPTPMSSRGAGARICSTRISLVRWHVLSGLRQLKLNQTAKIATCRGPLQARSLGLVSPTTLSSLSRWTNCSTTLATSQLQRSRRCCHFSATVLIFFAPRPAAELPLTWD